MENLSSSGLPVVLTVACSVVCVASEAVTWQLCLIDERSPALQSNNSLEGFVVDKVRIRNSESVAGLNPRVLVGTRLGH
jgi:hypothetical protein